MEENEPHTTKRKMAVAVPPKKKTKMEEEDENLSQEHLWNRPDPVPINPKTDRIVFQQFDSTYSMEEPLSNMPGSQIGLVPVSEKKQRNRN